MKRPQILKALKFINKNCTSINVHKYLARGLPYRFIGSASAFAYPLAQTRRQTKYINAVHAEVTGNTRPATKVLKLNKETVSSCCWCL